MSATEPDTAEMPFISRLIFAWICYFRVLFDGALAARVDRVMKGGEGPKQLPRAKPQEEPKEEEDEKPAPKKKPEPEKEPEAEAKPEPKPEPKKEPEPPPKPAQPPETSALELLAMLQRDGRLVDFLQQDITTFSDADVGAAARVVHEGCKKALAGHVQFAPIRSEEEETKVTVPEGYAASELKLTGNVTGSPPFAGTLRHKGWRVTDCKLPEPAPGRDPRVVAPAEVEL